ncbi:MAG: hypothetical protein EA377_03915 [Phycisphaerales bacterium]|nr:MAG: hypothetical protein EA377_03915 [Phycisphaerales bacterium]
MSRIGHTSNRHPLCPECGYDLVATVAQDGRTCPECGYEFEIHELRREVRRDDWTPARGLLNLAKIQGLKAIALGLIVAGVLGLLQILLEDTIRQAAGIISIFLLIGLLIVTAIVGGVAGAVLSKDANEQAGMDGIIVAVMGIIITAITITVAVVAVDLTFGFTIAPMTGVVLIATMVASITLIRRAIFDD